MITKPRGQPFKKSMREEPKAKPYVFKTFTPMESLDELKRPVKKPSDTSEICYVFFVHETDRGLFVQCGDDKRHWLPISQLKNFPKNTYTSGERITIDASLWILGQDDKLKSLKIPITADSIFIEDPEIVVDIQLVAQTGKAVLVYDPISDLDNWIPRKIIKTKGKFTFRKSKKMTFLLPAWFAKKYTIGNYKE